jgi:hypothetical protein
VPEFLQLFFPEAREFLDEFHRHLSRPR